MRHGVAWLALAMLSTFPLPAQEAPAGEPAVRDTPGELAKLNDTLREIAQLLRQQAETTELDLFLKRVQLADARLRDSERALTAVQSEQRSLEGERSQLELRLRIVAQEGGDQGADAGTLESMRGQIQLELARVRRRQGEVAASLSALENERAARRRDLEEWESVLDRRLGRRQ